MDRRYALWLFERIFFYLRSAAVSADGYLQPSHPKRRSDLGAMVPGSCHPGACRLHELKCVVH
jgi:hypothetical protein